MTETRVRFDPAVDFRPTRAIDRLRRIPLRLVLPILSFVLVIGSRMVLATLAPPSTYLDPAIAAISADLGRCTVTAEYEMPAQGTPQLLDIRSRALDADLAVAVLGPVSHILVGRTDATGRAVLTVPPSPSDGAGTVTVEVRVAGATCGTTYTSPRG